MEDAKLLMEKAEADAADAGRRLDAAREGHRSMVAAVEKAHRQLEGAPPEDLEGYLATAETFRRYLREYTQRLEERIKENNAAQEMLSKAWARYAAFLEGMYAGVARKYQHSPKCPTREMITGLVDPVMAEMAQVAAAAIDSTQARKAYLGLMERLEEIAREVSGERQGAVVGNHVWSYIAERPDYRALMSQMSGLFKD
jgi:DNA repair ATPase RecN